MTDLDDEFYEILYDADGNKVRRLKEQSPHFDREAASGFGLYDDSHGHCALCGRLTCRGGCFK